MTDCFVYDHVRTPRGRGKSDGALHEVGRDQQHQPADRDGQEGQDREAEGLGLERSMPVVAHAYLPPPTGAGARPAADSGTSLDPCWMVFHTLMNIRTTPER